MRLWPANNHLVRRLRDATVLVLALIGFFSSFDHDYLLLSADAREQRLFRHAAAPLPVELREFLSRVASVTRPGDRVAVVLDSSSGYPYFFAMYSLPGRIVHPANWKTGKGLDQLEASEVAAIWPAGIEPPPSFLLVERSAGGIIARKKP